MGVKIVIEQVRSEVYYENLTRGAELFNEECTRGGDQEFYENEQFSEG